MLLMKKIAGLRSVNPIEFVDRYFFTSYSFPIETAKDPSIYVKTRRGDEDEWKYLLMSRIAKAC